MTRFRDVTDAVDGDDGASDDDDDDAFDHVGHNGIYGAATLARVASYASWDGASSPLRASLELRPGAGRASRALLEEEEEENEDASGGGGGGGGGRGDEELDRALTGRRGRASTPAFLDATDPGAAATLAVARLIAASGRDALPRGLVRLMSPYQSNFRELKRIGKGGFGSVCAAVGRLDERAVAVKKIHFKSAVPPWADNDSLELLHEDLLREARALALMDHPCLVRYHGAWIEPRWSKLAGVGGGGGGGGSERKKNGVGGAIVRRDSALSFSSASSSDSETEYDDTTSGSVALAGSESALTLSPKKTTREDLNRDRSGDDGSGGDRDPAAGDSGDASVVWTPAALAANAFRWPYTLHITMELCPGSTLRDWIRLRPRGDVQPGALNHIFSSVAEALRYVHAHGIIHRDVKPANVLVHRGVSPLEPAVKLMDFGLAVFHEKNASGAGREGGRRGDGDGDGGGSDGGRPDAFTVGVGTATYVAPEQRSGHGRYTTAVDMYSLGVVLVEMITPLGYDATESERLTVIAEAKASNLREDAVSRFPKHAGLAKELMSIDPKLRPSAAAVLKRWPRINGGGVDRGSGGVGGRARAAPARTQSLPEMDLAALAESVELENQILAEETTANPNSRRPNGGGGGRSRLGLPDARRLDRLNEGSGGIDVGTASRDDLAAEVVRLQERLLMLGDEWRSNVVDPPVVIRENA